MEEDLFTVHPSQFRKQFVVLVSLLFKHFEVIVHLTQSAFGMAQVFDSWPYLILNSYYLVVFDVESISDPLNFIVELLHLK